MLKCKCCNTLILLLCSNFFCRQNEEQVRQNQSVETIAMYQRIIDTFIPFNASGKIIVKNPLFLSLSILFLFILTAFLPYVLRRSVLHRENTRFPR